MLKKTRIIAGVVCLLIFLTPVAYAQNYVKSLVENLLKIGYPISNEDILALDKIAMRFDTRNRLDVLKKILSDRDLIHGIQNAGYFTKTEAICNALRLLDEHNLPETNAMIDALSRQGGWEKREKERLSYMAAKRDIEYSANVDYLLAALKHYTNNSEMFSKVEISADILDFCNVLSYLSDIFSQTGDVKILNALIHYIERANGYPAEYSSRLLVNMFIHQPKVFVSVLAEKDEKTKKTIIDAMVFGVWNNQQKGNVIEVINKELDLTDDREKNIVFLLTTKINSRFADSPANGKDSHIDQNSKK